MRENTEKLGARRVAIREQLWPAENVCGGCNSVAIFGSLAGRCLEGFGFRRFRCCAWHAFSDAWGRIAHDQSADDCARVYRGPVLHRRSQSFCLPTSRRCVKAVRYFCEIMRTRFSNPASLTASRTLRDSQPLQGRFDAHTSAEPPASDLPFFLVARHLVRIPMNHPLRLSSAAALACALSVSVADASGRDSLVDRSGSANVFRSERRAVVNNGARTAQPTQREKYAAPVDRSPFDTPDTRPLRVSGDTLEPQPSVEHGAGDPAWPSNRVALGAGGNDSLGRALPRYEQRAQNWTDYLRANGSHAPGGRHSYAPTRPFDTARGPHGAPNPYDPSVPQPETRKFHDNGAGSNCTATGGAGASRSSCNIAW